LEKIDKPVKKAQKLHRATESSVQKGHLRASGIIEPAFSMEVKRKKKSGL